MTNPPNITKTNQPLKLSLEVATFDWRSTRIQFSLGFSITLITIALVVQEYFATRFLPLEYLAVGKLLTEGVSSIPADIGLRTDPLLYLQLLFFEHHSWWYRATCFIVSALTAMSVGLIALEATIRYGNRIGAAPAIFAALLYLTMPYHNALTLPATMLPILLSNFLSMFAIFLDLRFRLLRENGYYWFALLCIIVSGVLDVGGIVTATLGLAFTRLLLKENENRSPGGALHSYIGLVIYFLAMMVFVLPHTAMGISATTSVESAADFLKAIISGSSHGKLLQRLLPALLVTVFGIATIRLLSGSLWLRPILFAGSWFLASLGAWSVLSLETAGNAPTSAGLFLAPPFCLLLALSALPCIDALRRSMRVVLTALGALVLSAIVVSWGALLAVEVEKKYERSIELSLFKVELAKRMEKTAGKLAIINPPFYVSLESDVSSQFENPEAALAEKKANDERILQAILCSPMTGQKIPVVTRRRLPIAFVRISKKEMENGSTNDPATLVTDFYVWSAESGQLMPIYYSGASTLHLDTTEGVIRTEPEEVAQIKANDWAQIESGQPFIETGGDGLRLSAGSKDDLVVWFNIHEALDPTKTRKVVVTCAPQDFDRASPLALVFKGKDSEEVGIIQLHRVASERTRSANTLLEANTRGVADWNKHSGIARLGVKLNAGSPGIVVKSIDTAQGAR